MSFAVNAREDLSGRVDSVTWEAAIDSSVHLLPADPARAVSLLVSTLEKADSTAFPTLSGQTHLLLGNARFRMGNTRNAIQHFERSIHWFTLAADSAQLAAALNNLGAIQRHIGHYNEALDLYNRSLNIKQAQGDLEGSLRTLTNIGNVYSRQGYPLSATKVYLSALHLSDSLLQPQTSATLRLNLGILFKEQGQYKEALSSYDEALQTFQDLGDQTGIITTLTNKAGVYLDENNSERALELLHEALDASDGASDPVGKGYVLTNLGQAYLVQNNVSRAIETLEEALSLFIATSDEQGLIESQLYLSRALLQAGATERALQLIEQAAKATQNAGSLNLRISVYRTYRAILNARQQFRQSGILADSIEVWFEQQQTEKQSNLASDLRIRYALEEKERNLNQVREQVSALEQQQRIKDLQNSLLAAGLGLVLLSGGLIIFLLRRQQRLKEQAARITALELENERLQNETLQERIRDKDQWLTRFALHIAEKNNFLRDILKQMKSKSGQESARLRIRQYLNSAQAQEDFADESNRLHGNYQLILKERFPNLTERDIRLCALLRQGLTSKDIAGILNISDQSVDVARHRLRKKLNLDRSERIDDFLRDIS